MNSSSELKTSGSVLATAAALALAAGLTACATPIAPGPAGPGGEAPGGSTSVVGTGTVLQIGDAAAQFCLGAIMESYPPQCSGVELHGWEWSVDDGSVTASNVTWGTFAVWGVYDGESLAVIDSAMLALYDPMYLEDPALLPENAGESTDAELDAIGERLYDDAPFEVLYGGPENGYLFVTVVFDDGTYQEWADNRYGPDVVQIRSALVAVDGG